MGVRWACVRTSPPPLASASRGPGPRAARRAVESPMQPHQGQVIAQKYVLKEQIGRGGMATVWKAYHEVLDAHVAIKLLMKDATNEQVVRFHREAQAAARLRS